MYQKNHLNLQQVACLIFGSSQTQINTLLALDTPAKGAEGCRLESGIKIQFCNSTQRKASTLMLMNLQFKPENQKFISPQIHLKAQALVVAIV